MCFALVIAQTGKKKCPLGPGVEYNFLDNFGGKYGNKLQGVMNVGENTQNPILFLPHVSQNTKFVTSTNSLRKWVWTVSITVTVSLARFLLH